MKKLLTYIILTLVLIATNSYATTFVEGMVDIPLMNGLNQMTQDDIAFGNEESRIVEAYLSSRKIKFKAVEKFYNESLPQLGWTYQGNRGDDLLFYRDGDNLELAKESENPLVVRLTIITKP